MVSRRILLTLFGVALMATTLVAANVAGRWSITITTAEGTINGMGSLKQTGEEVTGWVGPSEDDPIPVSGKFKEGKLILKTLPQPGRTVAFDEVVLTIDRKTMSGTIEHGSHGKGTIKFVRSTSVRVAAQTPAERYRNELDPLIEDFVHQQQIPGFAIGVIRDNQLVYAHGFGVKNLAHNHDPVTPRSLFHMASITKTFVATSIMQLVEAGKINLDMPVVQYLPYFRLADDRYQTITVRQMVTHTSGMPDVEDYEWDKPQYDDGALQRYVRSLSNQKLIFAPGTDFRYSNIAFEVLGDLIAKVSGESFDDYVQHHILTPLKMKDSTLLIKKTNPKLMTWGHARDKDGHVFPSKVYPYNRMHSPSSNLHSNVEDMVRWALANLNRGELDGTRILKEQTYDIMWKPAHKLSDSDPHCGLSRTSGSCDSVGISWFLGEYRGQGTVSHGGGDPGYATFLVLLPEKKIAMVLMANCDWLGDGRAQIAQAALDVAQGLKPQPIAVTPSPR